MRAEAGRVARRHGGVYPCIRRPSVAALSWRRLQHPSQVGAWRPYRPTWVEDEVRSASGCARDRGGRSSPHDNHSRSSSPAIAVEGLTKRYGDVTAVDDLSFSVRAGAVTGFLGPNGAGKTTALKAIVGLARPTAGRALINGAPIDSMAPDARLLGVYIESCGAHPGRSARDHLRSLAALARLPRGRVDEVLAIVGLEQAAGRRVGRYSTGMRQRLGLASALLGDPEILVLDEPLNGLDPQGIRWLRTLLRERAASGGTVLLSSHVLSEAAQTVDDVVVIHQGRLVRQGSIEELERGWRRRRVRQHPDARAARAGSAARRRAGRVPERRRSAPDRGARRRPGGRARTRRARRVARAGAARRLARGRVLQPDRRGRRHDRPDQRRADQDRDDAHAARLRADRRGAGARQRPDRDPVLGRPGHGVRQAGGDRRSADLAVLLFGLVGAAGEYRHRTAAPAALAARRDARGGCCWPGRAPTPSPASRSGR